MTKRRTTKSCRPPGMLAALLSGHLAKYTKEALLSSPTFCRFAQESSRRAHGVLNEAMRSAQPVIEKAVARSQETIRELERKAGSAGSNAK